MLQNEFLYTRFVNILKATLELVHRYARCNTFRLELLVQESSESHTRCCGYIRCARVCSNSSIVAVSDTADFQRRLCLFFQLSHSLYYHLQVLPWKVQNMMCVKVWMCKEDHCLAAIRTFLLVS